MRIFAFIIALIALVASAGAFWGTVVIKHRYNDLDDYSRRLRGERDMYDSLYRSANTRLANFQDSINLHCICK